MQTRTVSGRGHACITGQGGEQWDWSCPFTVGWAGPGDGDGTSQMLTQMHSPQLGSLQAASSGAVQPQSAPSRDNSSSSANFHLGGGPGQVREQRWKQNPFQNLLGHQLRRLCAKLPMLRVPSILPDRACIRQTLFSAGPHIRRKKFYSITMARLAPFPKMLFCCICALPGSEEP